jgi:hypothetical protein
MVLVENMELGSLGGEGEKNVLWLFKQQEWP